MHCILYICGCLFVGVCIVFVCGWTDPPFPSLFFKAPPVTDRPTDPPTYLSPHTTHHQLMHPRPLFDLDRRRWATASSPRCLGPRPCPASGGRSTHSGTAARRYVGEEREGLDTGDGWMDGFDFCMVSPRRVGPIDRLHTDPSPQLPPPTTTKTNGNGRCRRHF